MQQQSQLETISQYSFNGSNLFQVSVIRQLGENAGYKPVFTFFTLAPGVVDQNGARTYDFSNKIVLKVSLDKALAFSHALRMMVYGQQKLFGQFSIFVDGSKSKFNQGQGMNKSIMLFDNYDQQKGIRSISIVFKIGGGQGKSFICSPPDALAISDIVKEMVMEGIKVGNNLTKVNVERSNIASQNQQVSAPATSPYQSQPQVGGNMMHNQQQPMQPVQPPQPPQPPQQPQPEVVPEAVPQVDPSVNVGGSEAIINNVASGFENTLMDNAPF